MPNWLPSWTNCCIPRFYSGPPYWAAVGVGGIGLGTVFAVGIGVGWAPGVGLALALFCLAGTVYLSWWLNIRLICLGGDRSAVGAIHNVLPPYKINPFDPDAYDTDYSFNLLLYPFGPGDSLPGSFVGNDRTGHFNAPEWDPISVIDLWGDLGADLGGTGSPFVNPNPPNWPIQAVQDQVNLILPQQYMAGLQLTFTGQASNDAQQLGLSNSGGSDQEYLLHCEIEGSGIYGLRALLYTLAGIYTAIGILSVIPIIGTAIALFLSFLAFLALLIGGALIQGYSPASPPDGDWGGYFNAYTANSGPDSPVDLAYVYGRWVYDSQHTGWNELHPVHFMIKIGTTTWGALTYPLTGSGIPDLLDIKAKLDNLYEVINDPSSFTTQAEPQNQWTLHPLLDGCMAGDGYPDPPPPQATQ